MRRCEFSAVTRAFPGIQTLFGSCRTAGNESCQRHLASDAGFCKNGFEVSPDSTFAHAEFLRERRNRAAPRKINRDTGFGGRQSVFVGQPCTMTFVSARECHAKRLQSLANLRIRQIQNRLHPVRETGVKFGIPSERARLGQGFPNKPVSVHTFVRAALLCHGAMMTTIDAVDQPSRLESVAILPMDEHVGMTSLRRALVAILRRIELRLLVGGLRRGMAIRARDPEKFLAYVAWRRRVFARIFERPIMASVDVEAVRISTAKAGVPSPPIPSDWFAPKLGEHKGVVFYVHGGSFITERSPRITNLVGRFAAAAKARVFAPNYRLAPEHPCPAAVEDIVEAYRWFKRVQPDEPIVAMAESAGAAILLAALQQARDAGETLPAGIMLLSPWVDLSLQSWSVIAASISRTASYSMEAMAIPVQLYLQDRTLPTDPVASPLFGDFAGFPPMMIHASKGDVLSDDALRLAERVRASRGELTVRLWTDEKHVWERMGTAKAKQSIMLAADFIRRRLDSAIH